MFDLESCIGQIFVPIPIVPTSLILIPTPISLIFSTSFPSPPHLRSNHTRHHPTVSIPIPIKDRKVKSRFATTYFTLKKLQVQAMRQCWMACAAKTTKKSSTEYSRNRQYCRYLTTKQSLYNSHAFIVLYPSLLPRLYTKLCRRSCGTTVNAIPIPAITAVSVIKLAPLPR